MEFGPLLAQISKTWVVDWAAAASLALLLVATVAALRLLRVGVHSVARGVLQREKEPARELAQKAKTLSQVVETTGRVAIFTVALLTALSLVGRDISPLLASAGIAGIAVGFGAQNLIKDWLGGFFIILENQYSVDDVIKVGEHSGVVEKIDLRRTVLRAVDGSAIVVPNGEVRVVTNMTKEWSRVVLDIAVPYDEDVDRAIEALRKVAASAASDPDIGAAVLEPPEVLGVESLGDKVTLRLWAKTLPSKQWSVARALRAKVKRQFDLDGIGVPYPHQVTIAKVQQPHAQGGGAQAGDQSGKSE